MADARGTQPVSPASVLVVDDHEDSRDMLAAFLALAGCAVETAANGAEAISRAERMRPHVVLMDLSLPGGVDGLAATHIIKSHPQLKDVFVIAVTAHAFPADVARAKKVGCHAVVTKPFDPEMLTLEVLRLARQPRALEA